MGDILSKFQLPSCHGLGMKGMSLPAEWVNESQTSFLCIGFTGVRKIPKLMLGFGYVSLSVPGPTPLIFCWIQKCIQECQ